MRGSITMTSARTAFRHNAFVYQSLDEYVVRSLAFLREGLDTGEGAVVANTRPGLAAMRDALGSDATRVTFVDVSTAYTRPARTLAAYHQVYIEQLSRVPSLRVVADVQFGPDPGEWDEWMGYEAMLTRSFAHMPSWNVCTYNANALADPVLEAVGRTHTEVLADGTWTESEQFEDPPELLRRVTPEPEPLSELRSISFGRDVETFRERLARELLAENVPQAKAFDMLVAATEIATNAVEHGGGVEEVRGGRVNGRFVCEIVDRGIGSSSFAPHQDSPPGSGSSCPRTAPGTESVPCR
jgi:hypothetical protein